MRISQQLTQKSIQAALIVAAMTFCAAAMAADVTVLQNNADQIQVRYRVEEVTWQTMETENITYRTPIVANSAADWAPGMPTLPARVIWLAIPPGASPTVQSAIPYGSYDQTAVPAPIAERIPSADGFGEFVVTEDPAFYSAVSPYPASWIEMKPPTTFRGLQVIQLVVFPFRYPSGSGGTMGVDSLDVTINLTGGNPSFSGFTRQIEDEFYNQMIANWWGDAKRWKLPKAVQTDVVDGWPDGDLYEITINETGIYKLTYNYLASAGIDVAALDPGKIRIFNNGGQTLPKDLIESRPDAPIENAIYIKGGSDGSFDPGDEVWFYGLSVNDWEPGWETSQQRYRFKHYVNPYTERNVYWLNFDPNGPDGKRMDDLGVDDAFNLNPTTTSVFEFDEKEIYAIYDSYNLPRHLPNLFGDVFSGSSTRTYSMNFEDVVDSGPAYLYVDIYGPDGQYHQFGVFINNEWIGNTINKNYSLEDILAIPDGVLQNGNNTIRLEHLSSGTAYMDFFELEYTRSLTVTSNRVDIVSPNNDGVANYEVSGLSDPWVFDVSDFANVKVTQQASFQDSCEKENPRRYIAQTPSALLSPEAISKDLRYGDEYVNLRSTLGADVLVICADQFYDAMAAYEQYREQDAPEPMEVLRVKVSDVFDEYGWGLVDPAAIRDFLKTTLPPYNWAMSPLFVLFAGDGDFDYKNKLVNNDQNWIIPFEEQVRCTDDWYAYFSAFDELYSYPQLALGRWPVQSVTEVEYMIERVIAYETEVEYGPWQSRVTFVADDEFGVGSAPSYFEEQHVRDTETIAETYLPDVVNVQKIYLTEYPVSWDPAGGGRRKPEANADLLAAINEGCLLVNFMGHGNPTVWAHEHVFLQSRDLPLMTNGYKLPMFLAATCDWAYWDNPFGQSMPEIMVTMREDGAIAAIAATRTTSGNANFDFLENFYSELFSIPESCRLGEALMRGKANVYYKNNDPQVWGNTNAEKYHLLGDPALRLAMPKLAVVIDEVSSDTLTALDHAKVSGRVETQDGSFVSNFDGIVNLQVFDIKIPVIFTFATGSTATYILPGDLIFRGDASVENGEFEAEFVVPVDISYGGEGGRYSTLAYSDNQSGIGYKNDVVFSESAVALTDDTPPEVKIYFDSPGYRDGDLVSTAATMYVEVTDSNGVNLTGSVGHGIVVTIDGQTPVDLTESFSYFLDSYTSGRAEYTFGGGELSPGVHTAEAIAWDAANNPNIASTTFEVVSASSDIRVTDALNYPNPMKSQTRFTFCLTEPANVTIKVYTVAGRLVKVISDVPGESSFNYDDDRLVWDGRDEKGDMLSNGAYIYKVIAENGAGARDEAIGKLIVMR
ncbi:MAG: type IX secretion system sortase PorU [bacterium]